ncbi:Propionyl-CoA carboxylase biotin-containing subunit, partial [hydrothermal vent metagenome]
MGFSKILIANRGEIACRIMRTAKRLGIATVAVYSEADRYALHVEMADEAVAIGPPPAAESYLNADRILAAAKATGADAVHPGYGFLSENAGFAKVLEAEGIIFIGPGPHAIEVMGDKIASKKFAAEAGVSTVPGHLGVIADADEAARIAAEVGYPVMLKASAGGGGKGMRIAWTEAEAREGFGLATNEAKSSFGDDRIFIEKFIVNPRHIEIQVLADTHGNTIHLGERECSIQRRNQKVIEEAPSPFLDEKSRARMGAQAVALAKAVAYKSAGTVEFIVDAERNFYFLEMNTRLQVEHPVTELVTGLDLVEQMIRIAQGEVLKLTQDDVTLTGWAIEARIYAEDPYRNFLPSIGRLVRYRPPREGQADGMTIRNDTGVFEGGEISMFYDPMIAKLCTHGASREAAIDHMRDALDRFVIHGIEHNIPFLAALMHHPRWREGRLTTNFIAEEYPDGFTGEEIDDETVQTMAIAAAVMDNISNHRRRGISGQMGGRPVVFSRPRVVMLAGRGIEVEVAYDDDFEVIFTEDDSRRLVRTAWKPGEPVIEAMIDDRAVAVQVRPILNGYRLSHRGLSHDARVYTPREAELAQLMPVKLPPDTSKLLLCPMPGRLVSLGVAAGQLVKAGETLCTVEAMKMEN